MAVLRFPSLASFDVRAAEMPGGTVERFLQLSQVLRDAAPRRKKTDALFLAPVDGGQKNYLVQTFLWSAWLPAAVASASVM